MKRFPKAGAVDIGNELYRVTMDAATASRARADCNAFGLAYRYELRQDGLVSEEFLAGPQRHQRRPNRACISTALGVSIAILYG